MKILLITFGAALFLGSSCKKNYTCECRNSLGVYEAGVIYGTKKKAQKQCESLAGGDTRCYTK